MCHYSNLFLIFSERTKRKTWINWINWINWNIEENNLSVILLFSLFSLCQLCQLFWLFFSWLFNRCCSSSGRSSFAWAATITWLFMVHHGASHTWTNRHRCRKTTVIATVIAISVITPGSTGTSATSVRVTVTAASLTPDEQERAGLPGLPPTAACAGRSGAARWLCRSHTSVWAIAAMQPVQPSTTIPITSDWKMLPSADRKSVV